MNSHRVVELVLELIRRHQPRFVARHRLGTRNHLAREVRSKASSPFGHVATRRCRRCLQPRYPLARCRLAERVSRRQRRESRWVAIFAIDRPPPAAERVTRLVLRCGLVDPCRFRMRAHAHDRPSARHLLGGEPLPVVVPAGPGGGSRRVSVRCGAKGCCKRGARWERGESREGELPVRCVGAEHRRLRASSDAASRASASRPLTPISCRRTQRSLPHHPIWDKEGAAGRSPPLSPPND